MQTRREWLAERGLAIAGARGKFSNEAKAALEKAKGEGVKWSDGEGTVPRVKSSVPKASNSVAKEESTGIVDLPVYRYTEEDYRAYQLVDGKKVERSLRSACNGCGLSLVVCYCPEPVIAALDGSSSVRVYVERR